MFETLEMWDDTQELTRSDPEEVGRIKQALLDLYGHADPPQFEKDFIEQSVWYDQQSLRMQLLITRFPFLSKVKANASMAYAVGYVVSWFEDNTIAIYYPPLVNIVRGIIVIEDADDVTIVDYNSQLQHDPRFKHIPRPWLFKPAA